MTTTPEREFEQRANAEWTDGTEIVRETIARAPGSVSVAPVGTPLDSSEWTEVGYTTEDGVETEIEEDDDLQGDPLPPSPEDMPEPAFLPYVAIYSTGAHRENLRAEYGDEWQPGEPLYFRGGGGYVRQLFQLLPDVEGSGMYGDQYWCHDCDVLWGTSDGLPVCWMCEQQVRPPSDRDEVDHRVWRGREARL